LGALTKQQHPDLLVGLERSDDAAVYRLNARQAIIQTVDFFPPIVDDPYTYGAVAAANSMSDVYAMGGRVLLALNVAGFPREFPRSAITKIFQGGADKVAEAGAVIAGGHTVVDKEPKYGLCVTGLVDPDRVTIKGGLEPGHRLFLSKPLGTGVIATAGKGERAKPAHMEAAIQSMTRLNRGAAEVLSELRVTGCTDVTGFGLLGHGAEMAKASGVALRIEAGRLPILPGALDYARKGFGTGGGARNRSALEDSVTIDKSIDEAMIQVLFDPQTSGGLLIAIPQDRGPELEQRMVADGFDCRRIGEVVAGSGVKVLP